MPARILVVDDDDATLELIRRVLESQGYSVMEARTGAEAIQWATQNNPDMILLDYMLPDVSGLDVCRQLRDLPRLGHTYIVMLTGHVRLLDRVESLAAGADNYLTKPIVPTQLLTDVNALLHRPRRS